MWLTWNGSVQKLGIALSTGAIVVDIIKENMWFIKEEEYGEIKWDLINKKKREVALSWLNVIENLASKKKWNYLIDKVKIFCLANKNNQ